MKDRWKLFWISVFLSLILAALFLFMGFSLRKVDLGNYGVLRYDYYDTVDIYQSPRANGNYLVGLDHSFIEFPRGFITHQFTITTLTKDKSMIQIEGIYIGKLVYSELINLYMTYGKEYTNFLFASVQELFHQALEQFSLNEVISSRVAVDLYVKNYVKSMVESQYQWVQTKFINLGGIRTELFTQALPVDITLQQLYLRKINTALLNQRKLNIYESGGFELVQSLQKSHGDLLYNITQELKTFTDKLASSTDPKDKENIISAIEYVINSESLPFLDNQVETLVSR